MLLPPLMDHLQPIAYQQALPAGHDGGRNVSNNQAAELMDRVQKVQEKLALLII